MVVAIAYVARNAVTASHDVGGRTAMVVDLTSALRVGLLQMSTMAGVVCVATVGAALGGATGGAEERLLADLEPSARRRWSSRFLTLLLALVSGTVLSALLTMALAIVQALRAGAAIGIGAAHWPAVGQVGWHAALVMVGLAAAGVLVSEYLATSPAAVVAVAVGGTWSMFLLGQVLGHAGDVVLPSAWVARWLHLAGDDYGVEYLWTSGAYAGGRALAGCAVAAVAIACAVLGVGRAGAVERR